MRETPLNRRTPLKAKKTALKRTKIRVVGQSSKSELKSEIQAILRAIVILRDKGCFLRHFSKEIESNYVSCGGIRNDGNLILQAEHLHSRANANSFAESRINVCTCQRHHIYYKPQYPATYNALARKFIGEKNYRLWEVIRTDRTPHKIDLKLSKIALEQELRTLLRKSVDNLNGFQNNTDIVVAEIFSKYKYLLK